MAESGLPFPQDDLGEERLAQDTPCPGDTAIAEGMYVPSDPGAARLSTYDCGFGVFVSW